MPIMAMGGEKWKKTRDKKPLHNGFEQNDSG
jgi:hypothetical protein